MKKTIFRIVIVLIVAVVIVSIFIPPLFRYVSYNHFLDRVDAVKILKVGNFVVDPLELQIKKVHGYYTSVIDPTKIGEEKTEVNIFPAASVRYKRLTDNLEKRLGSSDEVNSIKGFPMETFIKFYDKTNNIAALVLLQYAPEINRNVAILSVHSPIEMVTEDNPNAFIQADLRAFREDILNDLGKSNTNLDEQISVYSGKGIIVSIFYFTQKPDNLSEAQTSNIVNIENQFSRALMKVLYGA